MTAASPSSPFTVWRMLAAERGSFGATLGYSLAINVLGLTSSLYMLQIYDRVLASYSMATLVVLSLMAAFAFLALSGLEALRCSLLQRVGARVAHRLGPHAFHIQLRGAATQDAPALQPLRDVDTIRNLVGGPATAALFDLPWSPVYFLLLYMLHPALFWMTATATLMLAGVAYLNDRVNAQISDDAAREQLKALQFAESAARGGERALAMGATASLSEHWLHRARDAMAHGLTATERESGFHALAKFLRNVLQTLLLGVGAALTIAGELSSGGLIAGTILGTRALAPAEAGIGAWKTVLNARQAWTRLDAGLAMLLAAAPGMTLPRPKGAIVADNVALLPPGAQRPIVTRLSFELQPGEQMVVLGPSGAGKTTLLRAVMGLLPCVSGSIRIDGAEVAAWRRNDLGRWVGYLPQTPVLISGTVAQNIAHFADVSSDEIIAAAREAGAHDLILSLPQGYDTDLGVSVRLSGGQLQRIALAAALIGARPIAVLDEPESNLDSEGETQLRATLQRLRAQGTTVIVVSHRPSAVAQADKLLLLREGHSEFGPREEILAKIMRSTVAVPVKARATAT